VNVVTAMTRLWLQRRCPHSSITDVAAWYAARSALHQQIALLGGPDSEHARLLAERAHQRSIELLSAARTPGEW
jgi:hypothetical protein